MSNPIQGTLLMALLCCLIWGCGVEVGNPSEPTPTQPKEGGQPMVPGMPTVPIESINPMEPVETVKIDVRNMVENQYDEAITAALDFAFDNTSVALVAANDSRSCGMLEDGSLALNHQETNSATRTSGQAADSTRVTESFSRVFASRMQSPTMALACNTSLTKPKLDWNVLSDIKVDGTLERTNSRLIVSEPSQDFVRESSIKASGSHQSEVKKVKFEANVGLQLQRTLMFGTDMELTHRISNALPTLFQSRIETPRDAPLAIEESYNSESKLKSLKIVSGTVTSRKMDDGLLVIMRYNNVVLDAQGTCRPTSGSILGEVYSPEDPTKVFETFSIAFTARNNLIVYADGTGSKLEFEPCRIEIDNSNPQSSNSSGRGGRR